MRPASVAGPASPHPNRVVDAEIAQPRDPGNDCRRGKTELGDDVEREPGFRRRRDLGGERAVEVADGKAGVALRVAGDADLGNAARLHEAALDHLDRGMERAGRGGAIAADDERAPHPGVLGECTEMAVEIGGGGEGAGGDMGHHLETRRGEARGGLKLRGRRARPRGADIDRRPGRKSGGKRRDIVGGKAGRLERGARREGRDALLRLGPRRHGERGDHPRRREMT